MTAILLPNGKQQYFTTAGLPAVGYKVATFDAGTSNPRVTWQDALKVAQQTNPIILDGRGEASIFWEGAYKVQLQDSTGAPIWTQDNLQSLPNGFSFSLVPLVTNSVDLGSTTLSWRNVYLGPNNAPILDTVTGNVGYFARTQLEITAAIAPTNFFYPPGHVYRYGTNITPGTTDMTTALNNSIKAVGSGGTVIWPADKYKCVAPILAENLSGLTIQANAGNTLTGTVLQGVHNGKAILSLVGSVLCNVGPVSLVGDAVTKPLNGLLLGRSSAASAGNHNFYGTYVAGSYFLAGIYNVASEENNWHGIYCVPALAPIAGIYMSQTDVYAVGGLTGSSMEANNFFGPTIGDSDTTAGSTAVYLDCGAATGHIHFYSPFLIKSGGDSFITIRLGGLDGLDTTFPIGFHNCSGEHSGTAPITGLHITVAGGVQRILAGFTAKNLRLQTPSTNGILCDGAGGVYLFAPEISTPFRATGNLPSTFGRIDGGNLSLLSESAVTISRLQGSNVTTTSAAPTITTNAGANVIRNVNGTFYSLPAVTSALIEKRTVATYGATVAIDASLGNQFDIFVADGVAFTIANPTNSSDGQRITINMLNVSGGAAGAVTWGANFKLAAWTSPATGFTRAITFHFNSALWKEESRTTVDVPN